jgi:transposase-like protein
MGFSYPTQFRDDACRRMRDGEQVEVFAVGLGVAAGTLYRWKHQALVDAGRKAGVKAMSHANWPKFDGESRNLRLNSRW